MNVTYVPLWRTVLFNLALALWTGVLGLLWFPASLASQRLCILVARPWTTVALALAKYICGIDYTLRGERNIQLTRILIASKHQSALEIIVLLHLFPNAVFIIKRELIFIPVFGQYLWRMGYVHINRKRGAASFENMVEQSRAAAHTGRPIIIFPEGTRTPAGAKGRYLPGAAMLYDELKLPVLPVAINCGVYWPKNRLKKRPGTAIIEFLPKIAAGLPLREFLRTLEKTVETASNALYQEAIQSKGPPV